MGIGELLWEGTGKTQIMIVKKVDAEGVTVEFTWAGEVKGQGKAAGFNGSIIFTGETSGSHKQGGGCNYRPGHNVYV
ncbi:hypothetical protein GX563_06315 [Candidatus Bathyarchaeota archaeon]|nr:hypothetical protein [Candidatus Bathyarchaeota archaeon]